MTIHTLRQQSEKPAGQPNVALADYIAPKDSGRHDYIGAFAVTAGIGLDALCRRFDQDHDDYSSIMAKALADRLAEAFAEYLHKRVRAGYLELVKAEPERWRVVDSSQKWDVVQAELRKVILAKIS